jgi:hypothetical protein
MVHPQLCESNEVDSELFRIVSGIYVEQGSDEQSTTARRPFGRTSSMWFVTVLLPGPYVSHNTDKVSVQVYPRTHVPSLAAWET